MAIWRIYYRRRNQQTVARKRRHGKWISSARGRAWFGWWVYNWDKVSSFTFHASTSTRFRFRYAALIIEPRFRSNNRYMAHQHSVDGAVTGETIAQFPRASQPRSRPIARADRTLLSALWRRQSADHRYGAATSGETRFNCSATISSTVNLEVMLTDGKHSTFIAPMIENSRCVFWCITFEILFLVLSDHNRFSLRHGSNDDLHLTIKKARPFNSFPGVRHRLPRTWNFGRPSAPVRFYGILYHLFILFICLRDELFYIHKGTAQITL